VVISGHIFERPIKNLLGLKTSEFDGIATGSMGVVHAGNGVFHLHDTTSGKHIKSIDVHANDLVEDEPEPEEEPDED
jgi:hypothetical protein